MIANGLKTNKSLSGAFFASGVSNSKCQDGKEYLREKIELKKFIDCYNNFKVFYFSSFCAENPLSMYCCHKRQMEEYVVNNCSKFMVLRLPQVVGPVTNNTLVSFFVKKIVNEERIFVQRKAYRRLIDVEDVARICQMAGDPQIENKVMSCGPSTLMSVEEIIIEIAHVLNVKPIYEFVDSGDNQNVNVSEFVKFIGKEDHIFDLDYQKRILKKYVQLISNKL